MQRNFLALLISSVIFLSIGITGCTKVDTTSIGSDLIPNVDNIHTFDTTLDITTTQGLFTDDSTRVARTANHIVGNINYDPLFGKTTANLFLELKPSFFPYYFGNAGDTITGNPNVGIDSIVLCLSYKGLYGDSTLPQTFELYQMDNGVTNFVDSSYKLNFQPNVLSSKKIGETTFDPRAARNFTFLANHTDSVQNQIRIKISSTYATTFINELFGRDSTATAGNNAFYSDSAFKKFYKGFEIRSTSTTGNALYYVSLTDATTRLEVHYRKRRNNNVDTVYSSFPVSYLSGTGVSLAAHANYLQRDRSGTDISNWTSSSDALYIQSTPGSYANFEIPGLTGFPKCIIHRAELIVEQVPTTGPQGLLDDILISPSYLYVDLAPTGTSTVFKPLYYDLAPTSSYDPDNSTLGYFLPSNGIDFSYFGGYARTRFDVLSGKNITYYNFNLSRYVQNMIVKSTENYKLRLYAPFSTDYYGYIYPFNNSLAYGRVKIGSDKNPNYKPRLRIIYSKI
ncbi:DUF4270 family protein [Ferruginibacter sp. SUN002]|uniref:DUF4270 family protein n=1 Tax=Ferruginibacter sp. SUN002 TaxID=2937789 RepID=UPI003D368774